ncbi:MAG: HDIG domain-containing metalloprotein [Candidatus Ranarchaeia archaeon]
MVDITQEYIVEMYPEVNLIKDRTLRESTILVWIEAMKRGNWENLELPFTLLIPDTNISLKQHTKAVTELAISSAKIVSSYSGLEINMDHLIAGALLHDVGKLLEYTKSKDGKVIKSDDELRHPISGMKLAIEIGQVPQEVGHIIETHSWEGDDKERSPESQIVHRCDFIAFELAKYL